MASIEEETAKRYALMKQLNPWSAIAYLESQVREKDELIAQLRLELEGWPIDYEIDKPLDN